MRPWRFIVVFGTISLLADFVYEGARAIIGPLLASLGASAAVIGIVTGAGEAAALILRLVSGPLADHTRRFWLFTISGYTLTLVSVPLLGLTGTLWVACALVITERVGKAVRSPAKDTLLSHATAITGRGMGFAVHEGMDQVGALLGPLTVAAILAATGGNYAPALGVLALPGVVALALLVMLRARVPNPAEYETSTFTEQLTVPTTLRGLPVAFWRYAAFTAATMSGVATFGVLAFHLIAQHLLSAAMVPVLYAAAMGVDALAALGMGWLYDRVGARALLLVPLLASAAMVFGFTDHLTLVIVGVLLWGAVIGVQESTMRAVVADLVPVARRASAYGLFSAVVGAGTLAGGALAGILYTYSTTLLSNTFVVIQAAALLVLLASRIPNHIKPHRNHRTSAPEPGTAD